MKLAMNSRKTTIDSAHLDTTRSAPHDKEQLRRRLLKMILANEAQRRSASLGPGRSTRLSPARTARIDAIVEGCATGRATGAASVLQTPNAATLAVFDPDDQIGQELDVAAELAEERAAHKPE
jgi:hypothetical protein